LENAPTPIFLPAIQFFNSWRPECRHQKTKKVLKSEETALERQRIKNSRNDVEKKYNASGSAHESAHTK
jgi:hypothetical protein